ncbi:MAG: hypothetical protein ACWGMZ_03010, partial [Thermoguttaceae bacterium]
MNQARAFSSHSAEKKRIASQLKARTLVGIVLIVLAVFISYFPCLHGGFIWDDEGLLIKNHLVQASDGLYRLWCTTESVDYWPVTYTTFWFEWRL